MLTIRDQESKAMTLQFALCAFVLAFAFAGCQREQQDMPAVPPDVATVSVSSDYAVQAFEAAGGSLWYMTYINMYMSTLVHDL